MFSTVCYNSTLARIARVSKKGCVTQLLLLKRLPFGCICRGSANAGNRDGKGYQRCFSSYHCGRRRSFSTDRRLDAQVPLETTEPTAARNYRKLSQREIDCHSHRAKAVQVNRTSSE